MTKTAWLIAAAAALASIVALAILLQALAIGSLLRKVRYAQTYRSPPADADADTSDASASASASPGTLRAYSIVLDRGASKAMASTSRPGRIA